MKIDKKTVFAILLGVAAVVVVLYQLRAFSPGAKPATRTAVKPKPAPSESDDIQESIASIDGDKEPWQIAELDPAKIDFKRKDFRNPMKPLVKEKSTDKRGKASGPATRKINVGPTNALSLGYTIEGIVWDEASPLALINNQVVGTGDRLDDGSLIVEITPKRVRFTKNGKKYFLEFREE